MNPPKIAGTPTVQPTPAGAPALKIPTQELHDALNWLALNASEQFAVTARDLIPGWLDSAWEQYALAVDDLWELNTGADPYLYSDANPKLFSPADVRAFEIDQREERRDAALAQLLEAIQSAAPERAAP